MDDLAALEARVKSLEADRDRFLAALKQAVAEIIKNPIAMATMPKAMREYLKKYAQN